MADDSRGRKRGAQDDAQAGAQAGSEGEDLAPPGVLSGGSGESSEGSPRPLVSLYIFLVIIECPLTFCLDKIGIFNDDCSSTIQASMCQVFKYPVFKQACAKIAPICNISCHPPAPNFRFT